MLGFVYFPRIVEILMKVINSEANIIAEATGAPLPNPAIEERENLSRMIRTLTAITPRNERPWLKREFKALVLKTKGTKREVMEKALKLLVDRCSTMQMSHIDD